MDIKILVKIKRNAGGHSFRENFSLNFIKFKIVQLSVDKIKKLSLLA